MIAKVIFLITVISFLETGLSVADGASRNEQTTYAMRVSMAVQAARSRVRHGIEGG
jgi:hypothetical protein